MNAKVAPVKAEFEQTKGRLLKNLAVTPDDKLNWSPSPTARTPLEIAFHSAESIALLHSALSGQITMPPLTTEQMDSYSREKEKTAITRDEVVKLIEDSSASYIAWLETVDDDTLAGIWNTPFGEFPIAVGITFPTYHTASHVAQLEYIQTIYGDRIWH
jgi:hypothetical protein